MSDDHVQNLIEMAKNAAHAAYRDLTARYSVELFARPVVVAMVVSMLVKTMGEIDRKQLGETKRPIGVNDVVALCALLRAAAEEAVPE